MLILLMTENFYQRFQFWCFTDVKHPNTLEHSQSWDGELVRSAIVNPGFKFCHPSLTGGYLRIVSFQEKNPLFIRRSGRSHVTPALRQTPRRQYGYLKMQKNCLGPQQPLLERRQKEGSHVCLQRKDFICTGCKHLHFRIRMCALSLPVRVFHCIWR